MTVNRCTSARRLARGPTAARSLARSHLYFARSTIDQSMVAARSLYCLPLVHLSHFCPSLSGRSLVRSWAIAPLTADRSFARGPSPQITIARSFARERKLSGGQKINIYRSLVRSRAKAHPCTSPHPGMGLSNPVTPECSLSDVL